MDPVSLIVAAMVAGASSGAGEAAGQAVKDAYQGLKALLLRKLAGTAAGAAVVEQHENDPETWKAPLQKAVVDSGASQDEEVLAAASQLMELVDPAGARAGRYVIQQQATAYGQAQQAVQGQGTQTNAFGGPGAGDR